MMMMMMMNHTIGGDCEFLMLTHTHHVHLQQQQQQFTWVGDAPPTPPTHT